MTRLPSVLASLLAVVLLTLSSPACSERGSGESSSHVEVADPADGAALSDSSQVRASPGDTDAGSAIAKQEARMSAHEATFGAGCFWGAEATFRQVEGVLSTAVGYTGGSLADPTYEDVCSGQAGHAEVVQVEYDPTLVSYEELLEVFWKCHDPTTLNRQGPDVGTQYRSAIFFHTPQQQATAKASVAELQHSSRFDRDIVTEITPASRFYRAEEYHQQYLAKRGKTSCASTVRP